MKDKIQIQKQIYTFGRSQIASGDVREFLAKFDPMRTSDTEVKDRFGAISFRFEDLEGGEVNNHADLRILLRRLHAIWPWAGYFLDLDEPLGPEVGVNKTPLLALAMCAADRPLDAKQMLHVVKPQLRRFLFWSHEAIDRLGKRAGLQSRTTRARHRAVDKQFQSFLQKL